LAFKIVLFDVFQKVNHFTYEGESFHCPEKNNELFHSAFKNVIFSAFKT